MLVERHGGRVTAESEGVGKGTAFTVELPVLEPSPEHAAVAAAPASEKSAPTSRRGIRVLIVDDNIDVAELLADALRREGFETNVAHDAQGAIVSWRSFSPHAGVLDVGLPDADGYELARRLRAEHGQTPTLIAATGYGQKKDRQRAASAGFDCHMVKPVRVQDIVQELDARLLPPAV
jgi:CheY-like chemotaxis protein